MNKDSGNDEEGTHRFARLMPGKMPEVLHRISKGDRIPGDELLVALREHRDGPLPEAFLGYLEKPLSGWQEQKPGPVPEQYSHRFGEKTLLALVYRGFKAVVDGRGDDLEVVAGFASEHLHEIDPSFSNSEKAAQLTALYFGMDKRQGPGILNKISSRK
jgi:hypothetical protein